jgi:integrase
MISLGIEAYIPPINHNTPPPDPYILTGEELRAFLNQVDHFKHPQNSYRYQGASYSVLFRLYICCGLRRSEGLNIQTKDVDMKTGLLHIIHSKGNKDRSVFLTNDMLEMLKRYDSLVCNLVPNRNWFFISKNIDKPISTSAINGIFLKFWNNSGCANVAGKNPTIHSLRHTYVVNRMNNWMLENINIESMLPYLSKQLGHKSINGTQYYYHTTKASIPLLRELDKSSSIAIPKIVEQQSVEPNTSQLKKSIPCSLKNSKHHSFSDKIIPRVDEYDKK